MAREREPVHYVRAFEQQLNDAGLERFQREPYYNPMTGRKDDRVLGRYVVSRWRVSQDFWDRLIAPVVMDPQLTITYGGAPVEVDPRLSGEMAEMDLSMSEGAMG